MFALLTAVVFAQSSATITIGGKAKTPDSAAMKTRDSMTVRREIVRDSMRTVRRKNDSTEIAKRRAKQIALTSALVSSAFKDPQARSLLTMARAARLDQDSALMGYDATSYERMSVGMGFKRIGRDRLLMRAERAARVVWTRGNPSYVEVLGQRAVMPMVEGAGDGDMNLDESVALPYFPGREGLWIGSGLAKKDVAEEDVIHPLATGAEAYYTYATGDSVSFQLPGGKRIQLRELLIRPRVPKWNVALGSLWFDISSARLVRAVYRMAEPMNIWAIADEEAEDDGDKPPKWVKGMLSPMKAQVTAITVEYGLMEGQFWMPRMQALEGNAQAGFMHVPFKMEQSFKYASVNGKMPVDIPKVAVGDTASDSVSIAARVARRRSECKDGPSASRFRTRRRTDSGQIMIVKISCDSAALAHSPELPRSIYDPGEQLFGLKERDALVDEALTLGAQPGFIPQPIQFEYGISQTRYNKIEGLSSGIAAHQSLGAGYTAHASARIGVADWQPNGELGIARSDGRHTYGINAYRRLSSANDFSDPFSFGSSLSALLFGRDEGFYYRTLGAELTGTGDDSATGTWKLFAEHQSDAHKKTNFSLAGKIRSDKFDDNIDAKDGNYFGVAAERHGSRGLDPHGLRLFGLARAEAVTGSADYVRGMFDATVSRGLTKKLDGALTVAAGYSAGTVPIQRAWFLGGSQSVRGQAAGAAIGDAFWMSRVELGSSFVGARPVVFYDIGWAGDRKNFLDPGRPISGAGVGASFMDGLVRFDVARGIYPEKKIRANLYVEARF
ncbi:MAG TPA: BamA/TamA family outer membrane protein [Gemmatimonadaceae bacterium]|nr:BamA/TamA family outer membrane protein [Gemmatimonadaceae bacterium]